jgi:DNA uptake protein ComE-like DNA-binding protein
MYDINSASAIHLELLADIPRELADKIVVYRKKRKLIFYIDELYQIRGISRKYFGRLVSVFYATSNIVPGIGVKIQYVTGKQKH